MSKFYIDENKERIANPCVNCEHGWGSVSSGEDEKGRYVLSDSCHDHPCFERDMYLENKRKSK